MVQEVAPPSGGPASALPSSNSTPNTLLAERILSYSSHQCDSYLCYRQLSFFFFAVVVSLCLCREAASTLFNPPPPPTRVYISPLQLLVPFTLSWLWIEFSSVGPWGPSPLSLCRNSSVKRQKKEKRKKDGCFFFLRIPLVEAAAVVDAAPRRFQPPRLVAAAPQSCASPYIVPPITSQSCSLVARSLSLLFFFLVFWDVLINSKRGA